MNPNWLENEGTVVSWLTQFQSPADRDLALTILANVKAVSADEFADQFSSLVRERVGALPGVVGLYIETERRQQTARPTGRRQPDRLFKESRRKRKQAINGGPSILKLQNNPRKQVGSEGIIAQLATGIERQKGSRVLINPGPKLIRKAGKPVRRFILLTDFIGSGDRAYNYLQSAWRVRSVRSWWSRRSLAGLSFEVLAYSGTERGLKKVRGHPSRPRVEVVAGCPTVEERFSQPMRSRVIDLCRRHPPDADADLPPLGYGDTGALLAFHHGMPNNSPNLFWLKTRRWKPLFAARVTASLRHAFATEFGSPKTTMKTLSALGDRAPAAAVVEGLSASASIELLVMASLRRSPRTPLTVSARSGLNLELVKSTLAELEARGWIDDTRRPTMVGRASRSMLLADLSPGPLPKTNESPYYPRQLRTPRKLS